MPNKTYRYIVPKEHNHAVVIPVEIEIPIKIQNTPEASKLGVKLNALIDTGASNSCISKHYAESCKLPVRAFTNVRSAQGISIVPIYKIDLHISDELIFENVKVMEFIGGSDFDAIIGMDILSRGDMAIKNSSGEMVFEFSINKEDDL